MAGAMVGTKYILWEGPGGEILVTEPLAPLFDGESEEDYLNRVSARTGVQPGIRDCLRLPEKRRDELPTSFLDCWRWDGRAATVVVSLPLARTQILAETRTERDKRLTDSDRDKARLDDMGTAQQKAALATYRQQLRDLPATVQTDLEGKGTPAELEAYAPPWPAMP